MIHNIVASTSDEAFLKAGHLLMTEGAEMSSRGGVVRECEHVGITVKNAARSRGFLVPGRRANLAAQIAETMWVLYGRNDVDFLQRYLPRARLFSDDGATWRGGYGPRIRRWGQQTDQWRYAMELLREDPATRRAVIAIYDPAIDSTTGLDIPCNNWLHLQSRLGRLNMHVAVRSNDLMWGWSGINFFEWSAMLEITARYLGIIPGDLSFSISSLHIYGRHWGKMQKLLDVNDGAIFPQPVRHDAYSPGLGTEGGRLGTDDFDILAEEWFSIEDDIYDSGDPQMDRVDGFPEPMLRSWLRVIQWWWTRDTRFLEPLEGTRLGLAAHFALQPKQED